MMEKKIKDYEENRQLQNQMIKHLQEMVENLKKEKSEILEALDGKDKSIHKLKNKEVTECDCNNYNKSKEDLVKATSKHRDAAVSLKELCGKQKQKISEYREGIDTMELELRENKMK